MADGFAVAVADGVGRTVAGVDFKFVLGDDMATLASMGARARLFVGDTGSMVRGLEGV